jgi:hypothetical protein
MENNSGYIYCLSNPFYVDMYKIGMTERTPEERAKELSRTGVPGSFKIEFAKKVSNPKQKEKKIHTFLKSRGQHVDKEFFRVPLDEVKLLFGLMDGQEWCETVEEVQPPEFKQNKQSVKNNKKYGKFNVVQDAVIPTQYNKKDRPPYIKAFYTNPEDFVNKKMDGTKLFEFLQTYAKANQLSSNFTRQEFSKKTTKYIGDFKKRGNTGQKYQFPQTKTELNQHLFKVDEEYYRYINQLDDDFIPEFTVTTEIPTGGFRVHQNETDKNLFTLTQDKNKWSPHSDGAFSKQRWIYVYNRTL